MHYIISKEELDKLKEGTITAEEVHVEELVMWYDRSYVAAAVQDICPNMSVEEVKEVASHMCMGYDDAWDTECSLNKEIKDYLGEEEINKYK